MCPAKRRGIEEAADAAATCAVRLKNGDRLRHPACGGSTRLCSHTRRLRYPCQVGASADLIEPDEIVGADGLFKPADTLLREAVRQFDRLCHSVRAVGIDKEVALGTDSLSRGDDTLGITFRL